MAWVVNHLADKSGSGSPNHLGGAYMIKVSGNNAFVVPYDERYATKWDISDVANGNITLLASAQYGGYYDMSDTVTTVTMIHSPEEGQTNEYYIVSDYNSGTVKLYVEAPWIDVLRDTITLNGPVSSYTHGPQPSSEEDPAYFYITSYTDDCVYVYKITGVSGVEQLTYVTTVSGLPNAVIMINEWIPFLPPYFNDFINCIDEDGLLYSQEITFSDPGFTLGDTYYGVTGASKDLATDASTVYVANLDGYCVTLLAASGYSFLSGFRGHKNEVLEAINAGPEAVTVDGDYLYIVSSTMITVHDISGSVINAGTEVITVEDGDQGCDLSQCRDVITDGNYVYICSRGVSKIVVFDKSDIGSGNLTFVANYTGHIYLPSEIVINGNYAYVVNDGGTGGLVTILDITDTSNISYVNEFGTPSSNADTIAYRDGRVFVGVGNTLFVYDVSDPNNPALLASANGPEYVIDGIHDIEVTAGSDIVFSASEDNDAISANEVTESAEKTSTFTADGIVKKETTETFTADGVLTERYTSTFTVDGYVSVSPQDVCEKLVIRDRGTSAFTTDGILISRTFEITLPIDTVIREKLTSTFTVDGIVSRQYTSTFTVDAAAPARISSFTVDGIMLGKGKTFTVDGILKQQLTSTFTADGYVKKVTTATFTVDGVISYTPQDVCEKLVITDRSTSTFTVDGILKETKTEAFTADGIISITPQDVCEKLVIVDRGTSTFTVDGIVQKDAEVTFSADGIISVTPSDVCEKLVIADRHTSTFTVDGYVKHTRYEFFIVDGIVKKAGITATFTVDAIIASYKASTFTADGIMLKQTTSTFQTDGYIKKTDTTSFTADGVIQQGKATTFTTDGIVKETKTDTFTIDGIVKETKTDDFTVDGIVHSGVHVTFTADGIVKKTNITEPFTVDGYLKEILTETFTVDTVVHTGVHTTFSVDGIVKGTHLLSTFTVDGLMEEGRVVDLIDTWVRVEPENTVKYSYNINPGDEFMEYEFDFTKPTNPQTRTTKKTYIFAKSDFYISYCYDYQGLLWSGYMLVRAGQSVAIPDTARYAKVKVEWQINEKNPSTKFVLNKYVGLSAAEDTAQKEGSKSLVQGFNIWNRGSIFQFAKFLLRLIWPTGDQTELETLIDLPAQGDQTGREIYDAVYEAADDIETWTPGYDNHFVVVIDGPDTDSTHTYLEARNHAVIKKLKCFVVGLNIASTAIATEMRTLCDYTGGVYYPADDDQDITDAYAEIKEELISDHQPIWDIVQFNLVSL